jgi:ABC-type nickel/cobalt efflux system permease component RcnA
MAENNFYTALTHHYFEILGFLLMLVLGLELFLRHVRSLLAAARVLYLDVSSWKKKRNTFTRPRRREIGRVDEILR